MKRKKLYNVLFPIWILMFYPITWLIVIPGNFIIDSVVLFFGMYILKMSLKTQVYKKSILKVFLFGMLADIIGTLYMFIVGFVFETAQYGDEPQLTIPGVIIASVMIFVFNYFITFRKMEKKPRLILSILIAILTAPYTFLIPSDWIYME